jgi:hypothetical protein
MPWVEQANQISGNGITSTNVRPFVPVAVQARQGKIVWHSFAAVLPGDNVVYVKRQWVG